ncbi:MAG: SpoIIE family protein phosphatase, partial [Pseudomonadales bacterium]|nr:SpoIIE family protein phosphatase [Pseudomonadales bacterium]
AGHNPPLLTDADKNVIHVDSLHGPPVGASSHEYGEDVIWMTRDSTLLLYTDGVTEARNDKGQLYGENQLLEVLKTLDTNEPEAIINSTINSVEGFVGEAPRADDLTMVCLRLNVDAHPANYTRHTLLLGEREIDSGMATTRVRQFLDAASLDRDIHNTLSIALDEIITNIVTHGLTPDIRPYIFVVLERDNNQISLRLTDNGMEFNPMEAPVPDTSSPLDKREAGGLGIHLCRTLMDGMKYKRRNLRNHLTITKNLAADESGQSRISHSAC